MHPPVNPKDLELLWLQLQSNPLSRPSDIVLKFDLTEHSDPRERRWLWWMLLATARLYVRELYAHTPFQGCANSSAPGNSRQDAIRGPHGTLTWMTSD